MEKVMKIKHSAPTFVALSIITMGSSIRSAENDSTDTKTEITKRHDEAVKRLQDWIGKGAHAPDEYCVIESANPRIQGFDGA
jgi:hypothetical protein